MKALEAAQWMASVFIKQGWLDQETAVVEIERQFGESATYINNNGNMAIQKSVLKEFGKLTKDIAVWSNSDKAWRRRLSSDDPNKRKSDD